MALQTHTERMPAVLDPAEARAFFDTQARHFAGVSGEEFLAKWDKGDYHDTDLDETPEGRRIIYLALLAPFGRQNS